MNAVDPKAEYLILGKNKGEVDQLFRNSTIKYPCRLAFPEGSTKSCIGDYDISNN